MTDLLVHARRELVQSKQVRDTGDAALGRRQAAEKGWGWVVEQTTTALGLTVTGPKAHFLRKEALAELDRRGGTSLLRDYEEFEWRLHGDCFYDGRCRSDDVERYLLRAEEFVRVLHETIRRLERR